MNGFVSFLAILAICVTGTLTNPTGSEADPIPEIDVGIPTPIDCGWDEWGPCEDIKCGVGYQRRQSWPALNGGLACDGTARRKCFGEKFNWTSDNTDAKTWACCTSSEPCGLFEGDCDNDDECKGNFKCGEKHNCLDLNPGSSFSPGADCCYDPNNSTQGFTMIKYQMAVAEAHTSLKDSEGNSIDTSGNGPPPLDSIDCKWAECNYIVCNDVIGCGKGTQRRKNYPALNGGKDCTGEVVQKCMTDDMMINVLETLKLKKTIV